MLVMSKRKEIRAYARHKKYGRVMEPFDLELNKGRHSGLNRTGK